MEKRLSGILIVLVVIGLVWGFTSGLNSSKITREVSSNTVAPGDTIDVILKVSIKNRETYYVLEELIPEKWTLVESYNGGENKNSNALRWAVIQDAKDTEYKYKVKAPEETGKYTFSGEYMFEGFEEAKNTKGTTTITVK